MKRLATSLMTLVAAVAAITPVWGNLSDPEALNAGRARQNWILSCQGCHRADATGTPQTTPTMAGFVGNFLKVPGGREYLAQVPGVATANLSDAQLAEVLNWLLVRFDPANIPADFTPYTSAEVGRLRQAPLRVDAPAVRAHLVAQFDRSQQR